MQEEQEKEVRETSQRMDINSKVIFGNNKLCAQFLNDYVDIPLLKNIRPEDIEDVKERHHFFDNVELNSDTVKRIRVKSHAGNRSTAGDAHSETEQSIYLVSLIDHKSQVDYDVSMQLLRYMVCIWYNWEKEQVSKGKHRNKDYRYPPILPIIYYEGKGKWTAGYHLRDRILLSEYFADYIPDFRYQVIRVQDYDNRELLQKKDEISLLMLINKIQNVDDMKSFTDISPEELDAIAGQADEDVLNIISAVVQGLCRKLNLPDDETAEYVGKVKERNMGYLFENMEKMDIQAERRNTAWERARADEAEQKLGEAEQKLGNAEQKLGQTEQKLGEAEQKLDEAEQKLGEAERIFIETLQELGQSREAAVMRTSEKLGLEVTEAETMVSKYWK